MKRFLALLLAIIIGFLLVGCEEGPQYYCRYLPMNEGNYWAYKVSWDAMGEGSYLVSTYVVNFIDTSTQDGDSWYLRMKDGAGVGDVFPHFVRNKGNSVSVRYGDTYVQPDPEDGFQFVLSDPMDIGRQDERGYIQNQYLTFKGYVDYEVEAGYFTDVMWFQTQYSFSSGTYDLIYNEYFAPDVGLIYSYYKKTYHDSGIIYYFYSAELVDYHINPR